VVLKFSFIEFSKILDEKFLKILSSHHCGFYRDYVGMVGIAG